MSEAPTIEAGRLFLRRNEAAFILAARAGASAVLAFLIATALHQPEVYWPVMSAIIVSRGGAAGGGGTALERFLGSLAGAAVGLAMATLRRFGIPDWALLFFAIAPLSFLSVDSAAFRAAPIAAMIVLAADGRGHAWGDAGAAVLRIGDVGLGSLCALVVSQILFRNHPMRGLKADAAALMMPLANLLALMLKGEREKHERLNLKVRRDMRELVIAGRTLSPRHGAESPANRLTGAISRAYSAIAFLDRALAEAHASALGEILRPFTLAVRARLDRVEAVLLQATETDDSLAEARQAALGEIAQLHQREPAAHLEALPFLLACLCDDLDGLLTASQALRKD